MRIFTLLALVTAIAFINTSCDSYEMEEAGNCDNIRDRVLIEGAMYCVSGEIDVLENELAEVLKRVEEYERTHGSNGDVTGNTSRFEEPITTDPNEETTEETPELVLTQWEKDKLAELEELRAILERLDNKTLQDIDLCREYQRCHTILPNEPDRNRGGGWGHGPGGC